MIVGPNDRGKSTIIRALRWVAFNRPAGLRIRRHNTKRVSVWVDVPNHRVKRIRSKKTNVYKIDSKTLKAFGTEVPDQVTKVLNIHETNFQNQLDGPFWFLDTPGHVSQKLNAIVNLHLIDQVLATTSRETRDAKSALKHARERLQDAKRERNALKWIRRPARELKRIEQIAEDVITQCNRIAHLDDLIKDIEETERSTGRARELILAWEDVEQRAEEIRSRIQGTETRNRQLTNIINQIEKLEAEQCKNANALKRAKKKLRKYKTCPLCGAKMSTR